jgi:hypothetical protein
MNKKTLLLLGRLHDKYSTSRLKFDLSDVRMRDQRYRPQLRPDMLGSKKNPNQEIPKTYTTKSTMETSTIFQHGIFAQDIYASCRKT